MRNKHHVLSVLLSLAVASGLTLTSCTPAPPANDTSEAATTTTAATQPALGDEGHKEVTLELKGYLDADPELMAMMEKSIEKARAINPDHDTNPIQSVEDLYAFIDWAVEGVPWSLISAADYADLYDHIDQSVDYLWFLFDQPLEELEGKGYYYPTLQYHEPIASWLAKYSDVWGSYLSTTDSWNDEYYEKIKNDPTMNMQRGWYADENVWTTFNEWFSRHLIDPSVRPIADADVVAPADSTPQGVWDIDDTGNLVQKEGVAIKSANFTSIPQLLGEDSAYLSLIHI